MGNRFYDLNYVSKGISVNGVRINIRYATSEGLQRLLEEANKNGELKGLSINCKKTNYMVISKSEPPPSCTLINGDTLLEEVDAFNYLGSNVTSDGRCRNEIQRQSKLANEAFRKMKQILSDADQDLRPQNISLV